jgi:hypothetical protein
MRFPSVSDVLAVLLGPQPELEDAAPHDGPCCRVESEPELEVEL